MKGFRAGASLSALAGLLLVSLAKSAQGEIADWDRAVRPLDEGIPQVAVMRLRNVLKGQLAPADRKIALAKLGEALLASEEPEEALKILEDPTLQDLPATWLWRAQALATRQRWSEALPLYAKVAAQNPSLLRSTALFGQAEAFRALQRFDEALQTFALLLGDPLWNDRAQLRSIELLLDKRDNAGARRILDKARPAALADKKEKRYLQGRLEAQLNHSERAIELYQTILRRSEGSSRAVLIATLCAMAEAHLQLRTPEAGDDPLEDFIEHHPTDPELPTIFEKLDQLYRAERQPSSQELNRWANDPAQPRRALALWYFARAELRAGRREAASRAYAKLREQRAGFPGLAPGLFEAAQFEMEERNFDEALATLNEALALRPASPWSERIMLMAARVQYQARHFDKAAQSFEQVANTAPRLRRDSLYNASLAWLQQNDKDRFLADTKELTSGGVNDDTRADLLLEEGLTQAAQGNSKAGQTIADFLRQFPTHPRAAEAWVVLAELAFHAAPPRFDEARKNLDRARQSHPSATAAERADYLSIWINDAAQNSDPAKVISDADDFLRKYPESSFLADVRMKLAETYYRRQDFANAQTQFQLLAQENPRGPFTERALFFAAKSATQSMAAQSLDRALVLLDEVVKKNGELKWAARNEQAAIERKLGKNQDAATLYDEVLQGNAKPEEKREALCGKGDIFYETGETDRENYRRAIEVYDQLAGEKNAPLHWKNQALFKKGTCLEKLGDRENALAAFYQIVEEENRPDRPQREFFWYYKAGFNAARLLEDDSKWQPAAVVYQKLASAGGARSDEAKSRLSRLRLEHFLWEQ
ncbi:MAG TPA: tetratricopeptide repeat protein [Chthoniobacterales bacterium]|nr:tetratricopeptide repeat protein [Chthoniobacterales bacterium]